MSGPPQTARGAGVLVAKDIVGTKVTLPACGDLFDTGVHVGGRLTGVIGRTGPSGCVAND